MIDYRGSRLRRIAYQSFVISACICTAHLTHNSYAYAAPSGVLNLVSSSTLASSKKEPSEGGRGGSGRQTPPQSERQRYLESLNNLTISDKAIPKLTQIMMGHTPIERNSLRVILADNLGRPRRLGLIKNTNPAQLYEDSEAPPPQGENPISYGTPVLHAFDKSLVWTGAFSRDVTELRGKPTLLTLKAQSGELFTCTPDLTGIHWHMEAPSKARESSLIKDVFDFFVPPREHGPRDKFHPMTIEHVKPHMTNQGATMWQLMVGIGPWTLAEVDNTITLVQRIRGEDGSETWAVPHKPTGRPLPIKEQVSPGGTTHVAPEVTPLYLSSLPHKPGYPVAVLSYFVEHSFLPTQLDLEIRRWLNPVDAEDPSPPPWHKHGQARALTNVIQLNYPPLETLSDHNAYLELLTDLILAYHWPQARSQFTRFQQSPKEIARLQGRMRTYQKNNPELNVPADKHKASKLHEAALALRELDPTMAPAHNFRTLEEILQSVITETTGADELGDLTVWLMVQSFADEGVADKLSNFIVTIEALVSRYLDSSGIRGFTTAQWHAFLLWLKTAEELN